MPHPFVMATLNWARKLRYPTLFKIAAGMFLLDIVVLDPLPFFDELLFGMATLLLANWKQRRDPPAIARHD